MGITATHSHPTTRKPLTRGDGSRTLDGIAPPPRPCQTYFSGSFKLIMYARNGLPLRDNRIMAVTVSLSTRVSAELREQLLTEARGRGMTLGELARDLLAAGVNGG
jgi:hypothetical protein